MRSHENLTTRRFNRESFLPEVWEKIRNYLTPEQVSQAGLNITSMKITEELANRLCNYINHGRLRTFGQKSKNGRNVDFLYAPHFSIKKYFKNDGGCSCFVGRGAYGHYAYWLNATRRGSRGSIAQSRSDEYNDMAYRCMKMQDVYFAILKKYPRHLLDIEYLIKTDEGPDW